ncbi:hypothetical protein E3N88_31028 [Mikania micrantha]|uniref:UV-B-induced protein At3g17800, chloroplastic n=1 Tax=Mikania micrantha TaxID=192012 RepID=A0A5N6MR85_9ASTR|nr:hypothetical protein E3N88_43336 [Mikania micrantha]KAD3641804.1 hypothetical protein E3N88_31028 [Mikania micrantha]
MQISGGTFTDATAVFYSTNPSFGSSPEFRHVHTFSGSKLSPSISFFKGSRYESLRAWSCIAKASLDGSGSGHDFVRVAPLELESPVGQFLEQILQTHPHLLAAAIDQQLDNLQNEREAQKQEPAPSSTDSLRIAEVKEKERQKTLEEIMYCLIVQKFIDKEISMIPKLTGSDPTEWVDVWPNQELKLESVHSSEALEMIRNHVALVLGDRIVNPLESIVQISKIKLGKLYAASIIYGYFLKRVDERFQLERSMNTLPEGFKEEPSSYIEPPDPQSLFRDPDSLIPIRPDYDDEGSNDGDGTSYRLRSYVMHLDTETLQRYAKIRSSEAISLLEKQTQAVFGRPDIKISKDGFLGAANDDVVSVSFSGLTMLILESVAFGSFLWDAENYMESRYQFLKA